MISIGAVSKQTKLPTKTIRYYEQAGLIATPQRGANGYRFYNEKNVSELHFVKGARQAGFSVAQSKELLMLFRDKSRASSEVKKLTLAKITEIRQRIDALTAMVTKLEDLAEQCVGDENPDCSILQGLENNQLEP